MAGAALVAAGLGQPSLAAQGGPTHLDDATVGYSVCEEPRLLGAVKSVTVWEGLVRRDTGEERTRTRKLRVEFSDDGRHATETMFDRDDPRQAFPVHEYEFDARGRLFRQTLKLDGATPYTTTDCAYDDAGRLTRMTMNSRNPEFDHLVVTYEYRAGWSSIRFKSDVASLLETRTFDDEGRLTRSIQRDELRNTVRVEQEYTYFDGKRQTCWRSLTEKGGCVVHVFDAHGNQIEATMNDGFKRAELFEYDAAGNWTRHATQILADPLAATLPHGEEVLRLDRVAWREFTYRH